ncbi:hypothetical protein LSH36_820g00001, partial [Paralvinella palmiformis]
MTLIGRQYNMSSMCYLTCTILTERCWCICNRTPQSRDVSLVVCWGVNFKEEDENREKKQISRFYLFYLRHGEKSL